MYHFTPCLHRPAGQRRQQKKGSSADLAHALPSLDQDTAGFAIGPRKKQKSKKSKKSKNYAVWST
jgi:hypothetical protein